MDGTSISKFPFSDIEALAYLYVQSQDLSGIAPSELYSKYQEAYYEIKKEYFKKARAQWFQKKEEEARRS